MNKLRKLFNKLFVDDCNCILCGCELREKNKYGLCSECFGKLKWNDGAICLRCGKPIKDEANFCIECQNNKRYFDRARSALIYSGAIHKIILNYKFHGKRYLSKYLGNFITYTYTKHCFDSDILIPMPLSKKRRKERGYNQTELLLDGNAEWQLPIRKDILVKDKEVVPQTELSGRERRENVLGAYRVVDKVAVKDKKVVLIDDILTTGASVNEAARVLMSAGAKCVEVITVAIAPYKLPVQESVGAEF